ncbi:ubiquitin family protein [Aeromonas jandaei]|uniref:hypothetical protein n=1 Tax=Aeromonas jandaei TaxID=650 RepID=UPI0038D09543
MLNKTNVALTFATLICASSVFAKESPRTPSVVGFKPSFAIDLTNKKALGNFFIGEMHIGGELSVDTNNIAQRLQYVDLDGDLPDEAAFKYSWRIDGTEISNKHFVKFDDPNWKTKLLNKEPVLVITPVSKSGSPKEGKPLTIAKLAGYGVFGGGGGGNALKVPYVIEVKLDYKSSATLQANMLQGDQYVVYGKDLITAVPTRCNTMTGQCPDNMSAYTTFEWKVNNTPIGTPQVGKNTFLPAREHQGKVISVDVTEIGN